MIKINLKKMPDIPLEKSDVSSFKSSWYNNVRYEIWNGEKMLDSEQYVCFSSITKTVADIFSQLNDVGKTQLMKNGFTRYYCKNGDNKRRTKFMIYLIKFFEPLYKKIHIYWSEEHEEIIVDAYWKPTTPLDSIYALGSFLRLSWEQWHLCSLNENRNFEILCKTSTSDYIGHIPTLFLSSEGCYFRRCKNKGKIGRIATAILLNLIRQGKVYKRELKSCVFDGDRMDIKHKIQITAYNAVTVDPRFLSHKFNIGTAEEDDW